MIEEEPARSLSVVIKFGPWASYDRSSFELLTFHGWELLSRPFEKDSSRWRDYVEPLDKKNSPVTPNIKNPLRSKLRQKGENSKAHAGSIVSPTSKIILSVAVLFTLALTIYGQGKGREKDLREVKIDMNLVSDPLVRVGLPQGPRDVLQNILADLEKKAEQASRNGRPLADLDQKRLEVLLQKKQGGEL